jgi:thymidylate synthase (FAD)
LQDTTNRQNSIELGESIEESILREEWIRQQEEVLRAARRAYTWAINKGIAKEQARAVLPEGLMESRLYMNGTIRSWVHFIELRSANGTQLEHQQVAKACAEVISKVFSLVSNF